MSFIDHTKKGCSVKLTKQYKVGIIQTRDLPGLPSNDRSE